MVIPFEVATPIDKQELPSTLTPGQIHHGVLSAPTPNGWFARLDCHVDALVPRPLGSNGPVLGDQVMVKIIAINRKSGSVVGSLIDGKTISSIR
jgi:hypothetical protein